MESRQKESPLLEMFVVYERPRDYPEHFVVRRWFADKMTLDYELAPSLDDARKLVPPTADVCFPRSVLDDPCIVETWF